MKPNKKQNARFALIALMCLAFTAIGVWWLSGGLPSLAATSATPLDGSVKIASPAEVSPGSTVAYTIVISNSSLVSATTNVVVSDVLPPELSYVTGSASVSPGGTALWSDDDLPYITFTIPTVPTNTAISLMLEAEMTSTAQTGDLITNTAQIHFDGLIFDRSVVVEVAEAPTSKFLIPWDNQYITDRGDFEISGRAWTADQNPTYPNAPVIQPIVYLGSGNYDVIWNTVSGAVNYVLQEATSPAFYDVNEYEIVPPKTFKEFTGKTSGTYYYRLLVENTIGQSFWSDVESVNVPAANLSYLAEDPFSISSPDASYQPVVEVHIKKVGDPDNTWQPADVVLDNSGDWWNWTYTWPLPIEDDPQQYLVQTRAKDLSGNFDVDKIETVTVTVKNGTRFVYLPIVTRYYPPIPYPPTLDIASDDGYGNYALSWYYGHAQFTPSSYELEEATNAAFTNSTISTRTSPTYFYDKSPGTYYYRVRGVNAYGAGAWSNTQSILVKPQGYFDDFSNSSSGWLIGLYDATDSPAEDVIDFGYKNGEYRMWIRLATDGSHNEKTGTVAAPYDNTASEYTVEVDQHWAVAEDVGAYPPLNSKAALIFAATNDYSRIYSVEWNYQGQCNVWRNWEVSPPVDGVDRYHSDTYYYWGNCNANSGYNATNHVKVEVSGSQAKIYMNGVHFTTVNSSELLSLHDVGLVVGSWDWTPVDVRFDNFRVTLP